MERDGSEGNSVTNETWRQWWINYFWIFHGEGLLYLTRYTKDNSRKASLGHLAEKQVHKLPPEYLSVGILMVEKNSIISAELPTCGRIGTSSGNRTYYSGSKIGDSR